MSYTSEDQLIDIPIVNLLDAIDELNKPINKRIEDSSTWAITHKQKLLEVQKELLELKFSLISLRDGTY